MKFWVGNMWRIACSIIILTASQTCGAQGTPPPVEYVTEAQSRESKRQVEYAAEIAFVEYPVGKSFWYMPGPFMRAAFYKTHKTYPNSNFTHLSDKFVPTRLVRFEVTSWLLLETNAVGSRKYAYRIRIEDGTEAYMEAGVFGTYLKGWPNDRSTELTDKAKDADPRWIESNSKLFTADPIAIHAAAEEQKRAAATAANEQRAAAEKLATERQAEDKARRIAEEREYKRKGGVRIGMNKKQVLASNWGRPSSVNKTTGTFGVHEQWVYDGSYLYFQNGILKTIQN